MLLTPVFTLFLHPQLLRVSVFVAVCYSRERAPSCGGFVQQLCIGACARFSMLQSSEIFVTGLIDFHVVCHVVFVCCFRE